MTKEENKLREEITKLLGYINYEKSNWKEETTDWIIESIHQQIESSIPEIEKLKDNWKVCKENCGNKEECERANYYIETIWNPTFEEIITKLKNIIR